MRRPASHPGPHVRLISGWVFPPQGADLSFFALERTVAWLCLREAGYGGLPEPDRTRCCALKPANCSRAALRLLTSVAPQLVTSTDRRLWLPPGSSRPRAERAGPASSPTSCARALFFCVVCCCHSRVVVFVLCLCLCCASPTPASFLRPLFISADALFPSVPGPAETDTRSYEPKGGRAQPGGADASEHWPQWEAAAATSAAPTIFPPVTRPGDGAGGGGGGTFVDGALSGYNNPSLLVLTEGLDFAAGRPIDLMVSLGCGDPEGVSEGTVPTSLAYWFGQARVFNHWLIISFDVFGLIRFLPTHGQSVAQKARRREFADAFSGSSGPAPDIPQIYNMAFDVTLQEERTLRILRRAPGFSAVSPPPLPL